MAQRPIADDEMRVTMLGTGTPDPRFERFGSATLVEAGGLVLLIDAGRGASLRINQTGTRLGAIDAVFLTHYHSDHTAGLPDVWLSGYIPGPFGKRQKALRLYGPETIGDLAEGLMLAFRADKVERNAASMSDDATRLVAHEIAEGVVFDERGVTVTAFRNYHHDFAATYGYRIDFAGRSVTISGDTTYDERVARAAEGTDLLIHEVAAIDSSQKDNAFFTNVVMKGHTSPEDCGRVFSHARPKLAVLTHIVQLPGGKVGPSVESILDRVRTAYEGRVIAGQDLMHFVIGPDGIEVGQGPAGD